MQRKALKNVHEGVITKLTTRKGLMKNEKHFEELKKCEEDCPEYCRNKITEKYKKTAAERVWGMSEMKNIIEDFSISKKGGKKTKKRNFKKRQIQGKSTKKIKKQTKKRNAKPKKRT